jgi:hypothetical protein
MSDKTHTSEKAPDIQPEGSSAGRSITAQFTGPVDVRQAAGNLAMQRLSGVGAGSPFTFGRVNIHLDPKRPWLFTVEGNPTPMAIATELYGADFSMLLKKTAAVPVFAPEEEYEIIPELLLPAYRAQFHEAMRKVLDKDIDFVEDKVLETWVDSDDEDTLMTYVSWWAHRKDLRTETGQSYFDAFLSRLKRDTWYRDYGAWEGSSAPFLDKLYTEVENRSGELNTLIAQNSVEFGAYRPVWLTLDAFGQPRKPGEVTLKVNRELVEHSADMILAGLNGITWKGDSRVIRDTLVGLPPPEQAAVLREIMSRYDERKWGIFGKYGEAWEGGMLYWLLEDLKSGDRKLVADSLKANGVLPSETVDALVGGRGWGGRWLPWTTYKAQEATEFWADYAVKHEGTAGGKAAAVMGSFSSLWLPETAGTTVTTLITAGASVPKTGAFAVLGQTFPRVGTGLALTGTAVTSFNVTISVQEVVFEKDVWTGRDLSPDEVFSRGLMALSGILYLGASFTAAFQAGGPAPTEPTPSGGAGFGPPRLVYSGPGQPAAPVQMGPTGGAGGGRVVIIARGNVMTKVVIGEPTPAQAPSPTPRLGLVPPEPAPSVAPGAPPAPAFPTAPAPVVTAATAGGVATSIGAAPGQQPISQPEPDEQRRRRRPPIILYLPAAKGQDLDSYAALIGLLQHRPGRARDTNQRYRWGVLLPGRIPGAVWTRAAALGIHHEYVIFPYWSRDDVYGQTMTVDHLIEMQVTPIGGEGGFDNMANYRLMDTSNNSSVGTQLEHNIRKMRETLVGVTADQGWMYRDITFEVVTAPQQLTPGLWTQDELIAGAHLDAYDRLGRPPPP